MEFLRECLYLRECTYFDYIEFVLGVFFLVCPYKWNRLLRGILCAYAGLMLGSTAGFILVSGSFSGMLFGGIGGILVSLTLAYLIEDGSYLIGATIVVLKLLLIVTMVFVEECTMALFIGELILAVVIGVFLKEMLLEEEKRPLRQKSQLTLCGVFGVLEISASVIGIYRFDVLSLGKYLYSEEESLNFFLYLMKVDYSVMDYQIPLIMLLVVLMLVEAVWLFIRFRRMD